MQKEWATPTIQWFITILPVKMIGITWYNGITDHENISDTRYIQIPPVTTTQILGPTCPFSGTSVWYDRRMQKDRSCSFTAAVFLPALQRRRNQKIPMYRVPVAYSTVVFMQTHVNSSQMNGIPSWSLTPPCGFNIPPLGYDLVWLVNSMITSSFKWYNPAISKRKCVNGAWFIKYWVKHIRKIKYYRMDNRRKSPTCIGHSWVVSSAVAVTSS